MQAVIILGKRCMKHERVGGLFDISPERTLQLGPTLALEAAAWQAG